ncbi:MAG: hypothetical protein ACK4GN_02450 [Runella sp.]
MKTYATSLLIVFLLATTAVFAQKSTINSPHNYKRPVIQHTSSQKGIVQSEDRTPLKLENNVFSAHNYKQQSPGIRFDSEATLVLSTPVLGPAPQNPLLMPQHYKTYLGVSPVREQVARKYAAPKNQEVTR